MSFGMCQEPSSEMIVETLSRGESLRSENLKAIGSWSIYLTNQRLMGFPLPTDHLLAFWMDGERRRIRFQMREPD